MFLNPRVPFSVKEKIAMNDVAMSNAVNSCPLFSSDSIRRLRAEYEEIAKRSQRSAISYAKMETRLENAVSCMENGISLDVINKSLGIGKEKLLELAKENNITIKE